MEHAMGGNHQPQILNMGRPRKHNTFRESKLLWVGPQLFCLLLQNSIIHHVHWWCSVHQVGSMSYPAWWRRKPPACKWRLNCNLLCMKKLSRNSSLGWETNRTKQVMDLHGSVWRNMEESTGKITPEALFAASCKSLEPALCIWRNGGFYESLMKQYL